MSDQFFDSTNSTLSRHDQSYNEDEDEEYDALNSETFGEDAQTSNWEEAHEKMASEIRFEERRFDDENNELSERMASYILDDEGDDIVPRKPPMKSLLEPATSGQWWYGIENDVGTEGVSNRPPVMRPLPTEPATSRQWWNANQNEGEPSSEMKASTPILNMLWDNSKANSSAFAPVPDTTMPPRPPKIMTVQELEMNIRRDIELNPDSTSFSNMRRDPIVPRDSPNQELTPNASNNQMTRAAIPRRNRSMDMRYQRGGLYQQRYMVQAPEPLYPPLGNTSYLVPHRPDLRHRPGIHHRPDIRHHLRHPGPPVPPMLPNMPFHPAGPSRHPGPPFIPQFDPRIGDTRARPVYQENFPFVRQRQQQHGRLDPAVPPGPVVPAGPVDEYAGMMSLQDKHFISSIQMTQLNATQPYKADYYHLMLNQRQQPGRKIVNPNVKSNREATPKPPYVPLQFENSLGKLQIGSVTAPRKIIDMEPVENVESCPKSHEKKSNQILMQVEEMFNLILKLEEVHNPLAGSCVQADDMVGALQQRVLDILLVKKRLVTVMSIRKGKKLVLRLIPLLFNPDPLVEQLLQDLVPITKKDTEQLLLSFLPAIRTYLGNLTLSTLVSLIEKYDTEFLLSNKFTISVLANMIERAEHAIDECQDKITKENWKQNVLRLVSCTEDWGRAERPVVALDRSSLARHMWILNEATPVQRNTLIKALCIPTMNTSTENRI